MSITVEDINPVVKIQFKISKSGLLSMVFTVNDNPNGVKIPVGTSPLVLEDFMNVLHDGVMGLEKVMDGSIKGVEVLK